MVNGVLGVPKTALSLSNSVEGLPELRKTVRLTVIVYYSEKIQIDIRKGKGPTESSPGETRHNLPVVFSERKEISQIVLSSPRNNV